MELKLKNKRVLIQGSSSGLGLACAISFAIEGARVALCGRDEKRLKEAQKQVQGSIYIICDLDQPGAGAQLVKDATKTLGGIDILMTNTGGPPKGDFLDLKREDWVKGFDRLWLSAVESIHAALPFMKSQKWGRILLSTSSAAKEPIAHLTVSNSLRAGLLGLMKTLSQEVAKEGITVNALLPGYTRTERLAELGVAESEIVKNIPAGRLADPQEYAALAAFLGSELAGYITGQAIACDGGLIRGL
ncbi:MAG: SDR family oxidoreductase [Verrucomicrobia bacterium]|nr:SDR family oxidoreductase [Verrucomicrobiota bacterium]